MEMEFKGTKNWRIRKADETFFFIEADLNNAQINGFYPRVEVMQEDFGEHNGYTMELRKADALLISKAPDMLQMLKDIMYAIDNGIVYKTYKIKDLIKEATTL